MHDRRYQPGTLTLACMHHMRCSSRFHTFATSLKFGHVDLAQMQITSSRVSDPPMCTWASD